jgi:hypothetical protein
VIDSITFVGPFTWGHQDGTPSIFDEPVSGEHGLYLWTVPQLEAGEFVYYVGETGRSFGTRMEEHLKEHLAGFYHLYDPDLFQKGTKRMVWEGHWDVDRKRSVNEIVENYPTLCETIGRLTGLYRFFVASFDSEPRLRKRIEAAIALHLYSQEGIVGSFQDKGIRYTPRTSDEEPVRVKVVCPQPIVGMPTEVMA